MFEICAAPTPGPTRDSEAHAPEAGSESFIGDHHFMDTLARKYHAGSSLDIFPPGW